MTNPDPPRKYATPEDCPTFAELKENFPELVEAALRRVRTGSDLKLQADLSHLPPEIIEAIKNA